MVSKYISIGCLLFSLTSGAAAQRVVVDPGHDPLHAGAIGTCGEPEYRYNDRLVASFIEAFPERVALTRAPERAPHRLERSGARGKSAAFTVRESLAARTDFATEQQADLFISIHHDSTAARWITRDRRLCGGRGGRLLRSSFRRAHQIGFNIFVHHDATQPQFENSVRFARLLAQELMRIGRLPSNYHTPEVDDCRSCRPIDEAMGIWHQSLYVLRHAPMPAVLVEVGNIVDAEDEAIISTPEFRTAFARALKRAIDQYFETRLP